MSSTRTRAYILLAAAAWTIWVWTTRIWNILRDQQHSFGFKLVHGLLAVVSVGFGVAIAVIGWRRHRVAGRPAKGRAEAEAEAEV
jgi:hypothetical protein